MTLVVAGVDKYDIYILKKKVGEYVFKDNFSDEYLFFHPNMGNTFKCMYMYITVPQRFLNTIKFF